MISNIAAAVAQPFFKSRASVRCAAALILATTLTCTSARAEIPDPPEPDVPVPQTHEPDYGDPSLLSDIKAYYTAPLHWNGTDWAWFGGSLLAIGAAHHFDTQVRTHFVNKGGANVGENSEDLQDAIPTVAVIGATWLYAEFSDSSAGQRETWQMVEAAGLSGVTAYVLKFAAGRESPYQTSDPDEWGKSSGGGSFPSLHATAAFAVGTVLAESGNDDYRWLRRLLGYGLGVATSYERLKHNAHWLSDTVAGGALGAASAHFVMQRHSGAATSSGLELVPISGGAMLVYRRTLD